MAERPVKLRLVSREFEGFARSFEKQAAAFRARHGIEVEREFLEVHSLYERMVPGGGAKTPDYDLFLCITDWLPELMASGALTPLNEFLEADPPEGWPGSWSPSLLGLQTAPDGTIYGLPYHDGPEMLHYRTDLFESPKEREAFEKAHGYPLRPPVTWDEFLDVARFFTRPEEGLWGAVVAYYPDAHNNVYDFLIHLWSRGGALVDASWNPVFNSPTGREALQFYVDLLHKHKVVSEECLELDSVKSGFYFAEGKAAMMWNWCGFAAIAQNPEFSKIVDKNRCTVVPRGAGPGGAHVSLNIYWVLTIPAGSRNKEAAYRFIKETASAEMDKITSLEGGTGTRLSTWRDPELRKVYHYYDQIEESHAFAKSPLPIAEGAEVIEILNRMIDDAVKRRKGVQQSLDDAAAEVRRLFERAGYYSGNAPKIRGY